MINLRYHIVSLTAVFLALGLGILAGTTVIDQQVVKTLRTNTTALRNETDRLRGDIADLQRQLGVWENFGTAISPDLLQGQLAGRAVVILADAKVPGSLISQLNEAFRLANAKRPTRLTLTAKWTLDSSDLLRQLRLALGSTSNDRAALISEAAQRVGSRLGGSFDARSSVDLVRKLGEAGFVNVADLPDEGPFPAANAVVAVVSSGDPQQAPAIDEFFAPMLKALSRSRIACAAEPTTAVESLAQLVRGDRTLARSVCTVDHADTVPGRLSLVYALRDLISGKAAEHYGVRGGATAIAPSIGQA
jgi:Copper transport outer membrane protein, MctB